MKEYKELTELHQEMCHQFVEKSKEYGVNSSKSQDILNDIQWLENAVEKYLGAKMENHYFTKHTDSE